MVVRPIRQLAQQETDANNRNEEGFSCRICSGNIKKTRKMLLAQYDELRDEHTPKGYRVPLKNGKIKTISEGWTAQGKLSVK